MTGNSYNVPGMQSPAAFEALPMAANVNLDVAGSVVGHRPQFARMQSAVRHHLYHQHVVAFANHQRTYPRLLFHRRATLRARSPPTSSDT
jgi:hypothetical protein